MAIMKHDDIKRYDDENETILLLTFYFASLVVHLFLRTCTYIILYQNALHFFSFSLQIYLLLILLKDDYYDYH